MPWGCWGFFGACLGLRCPSDLADRRTRGRVPPLAASSGLSPRCRGFVVLLVVVSILWIPLVQASQGGQLFIYIQTISSYLQPPVAVVFILGCFWRRTNEKVALLCPAGGRLWGGFILQHLLGGCPAPGPEGGEAVP